MKPCKTLPPIGPRTAGWVLLLAGVTVCIAGYVHLHGWHRGFITSELYANVGTTLLGTAVAVLVIDRLAEGRASREAMERLIRDVASADRNLALRALRELRSLGHLSNSDLDGRDFSMADLRDGELEGMRARRARFYGTKFARSDLSRTDLDGAAFNRADLTRCNLEEAVLTKTELIETTLENADCAAADFAEAHFLAAILTGADFQRANLENVRFEGVDLRGAKLRGARIGGATLDRDSILPLDAPEPVELSTCVRQWRIGMVWNA